MDGRTSPSGRRVHPDDRDRPRISVGQHPAKPRLTRSIELIRIEVDRRPLVRDPDDVAPLPRRRRLPERILQQSDYLEISHSNPRSGQQPLTSLVNDSSDRQEPNKCLLCDRHHSTIDAETIGHVRPQRR